MSQTDWTKVATKDELPDGEMIGVNFATRLSSGELFSDELEVQCPLHDSKFSFVDGKPNQVPADKPVAVYEVKVVDDEIFVGPAK
jgi:nitrite reductase/ring-hydroxylating ferredoxin subunit